MNVWDRPRTKLRISMGICPDCGDRPAAVGGNRCAECRDKGNLQRRKKYAADRRSGKPRFTSEKYLELAQEKREKRAARRAAGLCLQCGKESLRFLRCRACREKNARAKERYRMRRKAQEINRMRGVAA